VLPNVDTDGDGIVDAWETLLGTSASSRDSDGDGCSDGEELLGYVRPDGWVSSDPLVSGCAFSDIFADGFESGNTGQWSSVVP